MTWGKSPQWWTALSFCILMGSLLTFAYLSRKPLCIDSKLVEKIDRAEEKQVFTAYRCGLFRHVPFEPNLAGSIRDISRRLQKLERALEWLGSLEKRVTITVLATEKNHFRVDGSDIFLSDDVLNAGGQLEKAILKVWLTERNPSLGKNFPRITESLTDLLYFSITGSLNIQDPRTGVTLDEESASRWPQLLTNLQGYCLSPWLFSEHLGLCHKISSELQSKTDLYPESLRPIVSQSLVSTLDKLSGGERLRWLKNFVQRLAQLKSVDLSKPGQRPFTEAHASLTEWMRLMTSIPGDIRIVGKFAWLFRQELLHRGFGAGVENQLEVLVFQDHISPELTSSLKTSLEKNKDHFSMAIEDSDRIYFSDQSNLRKNMFSQFQAVKGLYLNCGVLDLHRLQALASRVQRLLYVDVCGVSELKLEGFLGRGVMSFALQNIQVKFVDFHSSSLLSALQKMPEANPIEALTQSQTENSFLRKIGWDKPIFDQTSGAYRAKSVIEAVDWYRL
jgi:hypothetical protein